MSKTYEALLRAKESSDDNYTGNSTLPSLSEEYEARLTNNLKQLQMVEGNILGANKDAKTIYVTSCFNFEGKTTSAINLAYALTINGTAQVLLIDGNPSSPKIHELFHTEITPGLTDLFYSETKMSDVLKKTAYKNLSIITFGSSSFDRPNLFAENSHKGKIDLLSEKFDFIVFDGNSVMGSYESAIIANWFDGIVIVVECEKTRWEVVQETVEKIKNVGGNILGVVLNKRRFYIPKALYDKI